MNYFKFLKKIILIILFFILQINTNDNLINLGYFNENLNNENIEDENDIIFPIESINEYRNFIKNIKIDDIEKIKEEILKVEKSENEPDEIFAIRELREIFMNLEKSKIRLEESIKGYESLIDSFFHEKFFMKKNENYFKKISFDEIKNCIFLIEILKEKLDFLDLEIEKLQNDESIKNSKLKINNIEKEERDLKHDNHKQRRFKNSLFKKKINYYFKIMKKSFFKEKELELKIMISKKKIFKEKLKFLKEILNKSKDEAIFSEKKLKEIYDSEKKLEQSYFDEKDLLINNYHKFLNSLDYEFKNQIENIFLEKELNETIEILKNFKIENNEIIKKKINLLSMIIKKELKNTEIDYLDKKILISYKNIEFAEAWYFILMEKIYPKDIKYLLESFENLNFKDEIQYLEKKKDDYLKIISHYSFLENILTKEKDNISNNDLEIKNIDEQQNILLNIVEIYSKLITMLNETYYITNGIKNELKIKKFWLRSKHSITIEELTNLSPDLKIFFLNLTNRFLPFLKNLYSFFSLENSAEKIQVLIFILNIILILIIGIFYKNNILDIKKFFLQKSREYFFFARLNLIFNFLLDQGLIFYWWVAMFVFVNTNINPSSYASAAYFILSIPYFWYLIYKFFKSFELINKERDFLFVNHDYIKRFLFFMKIFFYCISLTFFFKEAFYKIGPVSSSVLSIITAFQYIITQMTLIFLIKKDQICNLIPEINIFFIFLKNLFSKYYSIFLFFTISIIIMSNPYVGYGNQVIYFTTRIIFSFLFFPIIYNLYIFIKNKSLILFIDINESEVKNKFPGGKTCYIIFISMIYFLIIWLSYLIFCKTWDLIYSENIISKILNKNLIEINPEAQERILFLSLFDIIRVIILTIFGYIFSYIFNNLIVKQILHDIIISVSMQNTIMTLVQYLFVFFSFIISLYASGLQSLTTKIAFFIGFLGFAIKEPFSDFISYFIILIQRPIKVGDLIKVNYEYEIIGIVRQITPRTTLLRQRNSQIIIVPNSLIVTKLICNWNYSKNAYIATEDIFLSVNFDSDIDLVKIILQKTVESNFAILRNPAPIIRCENFTPSGYEFLVRGYILAERAIEIFEITSQLRILIVKALALKNIKISAPHYFVKVEKNIEKALIENKEEKGDK